MRMHEHAKLIGKKGIILVPYCKHQVGKYNSWMKDEELRKSTQMERLTLAGESMYGGRCQYSPKRRRKGLDEEAIRMILKFAYQFLGARHFEDNIINLRFLQKIGFFVTSLCNELVLAEAMTHLEITENKYP
uniref:N-acetyltransferase domain-containing protein n=1 Tax=Elaeophora elaphi TaxID=1147741 RepID=A0A0R3S3S1_9BILA